MPIKEENKKLYPPNWKEISEKKREKANNRCEECGVPNGQLIYRDERGWHLAPEVHQADAMALDGIKFVKIVLTVMHLDHNPRNCEDSNLRAACQRCHNRYDSQHRKQTRKKTLNEKRKQTGLEL